MPLPLLLPLQDKEIQRLNNTYGNILKGSGVTSVGEPLRLWAGLCAYAACLLHSTHTCMLPPPPPMALHTQAACNVHLLLG